MTRATTFLNLITATAFAAALVVPAITHEAPKGDWVGSQGQIDSLPATEANVPAWQPEYAAEFPGCTSGQQEAVSDLIVYTLRGDAQRMDFAEAWERGHNADDADDVWVVGYCA